MVLTGLYLQYWTTRFLFTMIVSMLQVLDDPAEDNLHMGERTTFSLSKIFHSIPPPPRQPLALGTYATNKCSYNLFIIKIVPPLPSTPPQGGYIMQKSLHQQCQVTVRTPVSVKTSKPFMCLFS